MLRFTNSRGDVVQMGEDPYRLFNFEGRGSLGASVQSQKSPYQDGETFIDSSINIREVLIELRITSSDSMHRSNLSKVFNPKLGQGLLEYIDDDIHKELICTVEVAPSFPKSNALQECEIELLALQPYWRSPTIEEEPTFEGFFEFPFEGEFEMGIQRDNRIIDNDGDTETPLQIEFYGPAENPRIENVTTGEFIKVNQTLGEDEFMKIDTTPGEKSVVFVNAENGDERNVFNWIDLESTFFQLAIGENEIKYTADNDIQGAEVNIYWQKQFVGV